MHVFPLQYIQLPGVNCVCIPVSSDSHQLNIAPIIIGVDRSSVLSLKLGWLARCRVYRSMLT